MSEESATPNQERAVVVGVGLKNESLIEIKESLCELEDLVRAAGGDVVASITQVLPQWNPATLIGTGKVEEVGNLVEDSGATVVVLDHQLSGAQIRNLEVAVKARIVDRNQLILDIFAMRAQTFEGKLQVELAQMLDQLPRMVDAWMGSLSRQGGGIGTRGPGETALEIDRRRVRERVAAIRKKLESVRQKRAQHRQSRRRSAVPSFALIGYTNSGKSSLLNQITNAEVLAKDQVFATLDPITRKLKLPGGPDAVITDTVGFIRRLPPQFVEAFKATLEESGDADVLLHVIDLSSPQMEKQVEVVDALIHEFQWDKKPIIHVYNKIDVAPFDRRFKIRQHPRVFISAVTGEGIGDLYRAMVEELEGLKKTYELYIPRSENYKVFDLQKEAQIVRKEEATGGTVCVVKLTATQVNHWKPYLT